MPVTTVTAILDLDDADALDGEEFVAGVQNGQTVKIRTGDLVPLADTPTAQRYTAPILFELGSDTAPLTTGTKWTGRMPFGLIPTAVKASSITPSTSGQWTVDILIAGVSIFSTPLTVDAGDTTSLDATIPAVISSTGIADDTEITVVVTAAGSGVLGAKAWLIGTRDDTIVSTPPVVDTSRIAESFDSGTDGEEANELTTSWDSSSGSGTLTHTSLDSIDGGSALRIFGDTEHRGRWVLPVDPVRRKRHYWQLRQAPSEQTFNVQVYAGDHTTVAYQFGVDENRHVYLQDGTTGTGTHDDLSAFGLSLGDWYAIEENAVGGDEVRIAFYTGANINNTGEVGAVGVLSIDVTAVSFSDVEVGLMDDIPGGGTVVPANLVNEPFTHTVNGTTVTAALLTATDMTGTGVLTFAVGSFLNGDTSGLLINITGSRYARYNKPLHTHHFARGRILYTSAPTGSTSWFNQIRNGDNSLTAYQVGIGTDGKLKLRDLISGTGSSAITATTAFTTATEYEILIDAPGGGKPTITIYDGATIDADPSGATPLETHTMVNDLTEADFSNEHLGQMSAVTGAPSYKILRWASSDTAMPSHPNVIGSSPIDLLIDHWFEDANVMPDPYPVSIPDDPGNTFVDSNNMPVTGCWWGAHTPPAGAQGMTQAGLNLWMAFARRRPDVLHFYKSGANWDGILTANERSMLEPAGAARAIPMFNWKIASNRSFASVAAGGNDAIITTWAGNISQYPWIVLIALEHEPDNNSNRGDPGYTDADYVAMWRHIVQLARANGATNVRWVWNMTGYSSWALTADGDGYMALWPGDDVVDIIAGNPYFQSTNRIDFGLGTSGGSPRSLINENVDGPSGWPGFYTFATTAHPAVGGGYSYSGTKPFALLEWGTWFDVMTDTQCADRIRTIADQIELFPRCKMLLHWNNNQDHMNHIDGHTLSEDAFGDVGELAWFNVGTVNAR